MLAVAITKYVKCITSWNFLFEKKEYDRWRSYFTIINLKHNHTNVNYQTGEKWPYVQGICNKVYIIIRKNKNSIKKLRKDLKIVTTLHFNHFERLLCKRNL